MINKDQYYPVSDRFLSEREAAKILSISIPTLRRLLDPPRLQVGPRRVAYRYSDIMRKIEQALPKRTAGSLVLLLIVGARVFVGGLSP
jgi:predicted DNA-binding transcriptional regulator AlpA